MAETKPKKKKLRGLPKIIWGFFAPLNDNDYFQKKFEDTDVKILLNAKDGRYAALIKINNGKIEIDGVPNKDKKELKKKKLGWDGKLETTTQIFMDIAMNKISLWGIIGKIFTRKIKIRGIRKLLILLKVFDILAYEEKKANEAKNE